MTTATINGISLTWEARGPANGLPVLLAHAFPLRGALWAVQAEALAREAGCHVVVPDLRGFGASDAPPGPYPMDLYATDLLALADHLGFERFVLGGISMGGYIAFALLRAAPQRLRCLILTDTKASADSDEGRAGRETMAQLAEREGAPAVAEVMLPRLLSATGVANADLAATVSEWIAANSPQGIAGAARGMALRPNATDLLGQIACPTLIISGDQDVTTPVHDAQAMFDAIPAAKLEIIPDAGHLSNLEAPEAVTQAMLHFVRGLA